MRGAFSAAYFDPGGGAIALFDSCATANAGRDAPCGFHILAGWTDPSGDASVMTWAADFHDALAPHATGGVYVVLLADDEPDHGRVCTAFLALGWIRRVASVDLVVLSDHDEQRLPATAVAWMGAHAADSERRHGYNWHWMSDPTHFDQDRLP